MILNIGYWILGISIAILILAGLMAINLLLFLLKYVIAVLIIAFIIVAGLQELSNKKPPE